MKRFYLTNENSKQVLHAWFPAWEKHRQAELFAVQEDLYLYIQGVPLRYKKPTPNNLDAAIKQADAQQLSYGQYMLKTYWGKP